MSDYSKATECYAIPGSDTMIDMINPENGLTVCYGKTAEDVQREDPAAIRMTYQAWSAAKAERQNVPVQWLNTTERKYNEMNEVLPPAFYGSRGFLVGEPYDYEAKTGQPRFQAFRHVGHHYLESSRPMTVAEFRALS